MKHFFEQYGGVALGILALLVLIAMITPVGNIIKTSLQGTANKFSGSMYEQLDGAMNATASAQNSALSVIGGSDGGSGNPGASSNPYKNKVASAQKLYDVGEASLTADDIVTVNGIDCYVLQVDEANKKAELITKDIYDVRFDTGGHTAEETTHLGTGSYANKTYDYYYSALRTWMNEFYRTQLGADSRILPTTVTYYTKDSSDGNLDTYATGTIADQYVFALDAKEAKQYKSKFSWNYANQMSGRGYGFWTTAGYRSGSYSNAWSVSYYGYFDSSTVAYSDIGARPVFWISLE